VFFCFFFMGSACFFFSARVREMGYLPSLHSPSPLFPHSLRLTRAIRRGSPFPSSFFPPLPPFPPFLFSLRSGMKVRDQSERISCGL